MKNTLQIDLKDPAERLAMRAMLAVLDAEEAKSQGRAPGEPAAADSDGAAATTTAAAPAAQSAPAAPPSEAATPPVEGDGEALLTDEQKAEVVRLQTERVADVDQARTELKAMLQKCFSVSSLGQLRAKWLHYVMDYVKTGKSPEEIPFG